MITSINDPEILSKTLRLGDRPIDMFKFLVPLLGENNQQVYPAERAKNVRRTLQPALGHHGTFIN